MTYRIYHLNIGLAIAALALVVYYVTQMNGLAAQAWRIQDAQQRLAALRDAKNGLVAQRAALDDREQLMLVAQRAGMVPVAMNAVVYLTQDRPVAVR